MKNSHKVYKVYKVHKVKSWADFRLSTSSGYTLLFAMIVAAIVLAIGVSLLTISRKEFDLSSSAKQSSNAFYAADSGIGCAEYWANTSGPDKFATSSYANPGSITCSSVASAQQVTVFGCSSNSSENSSCSDPNLKSGGLPTNLAGGTIPGFNYGNTYEFTFYAPFSTDGTSNQSCAAVTVEKYLHDDNDLGTVHVYTDITSAGYNIGWNQTNANPLTGNCNTISPKKVNRTLELTY